MPTPARSWKRLTYFSYITTGGTIASSALWLTSGHQNCERIDFCFFKPPSLWKSVIAKLGNKYTPPSVFSTMSASIHAAWLCLGLLIALAQLLNLHFHCQGPASCHWHSFISLLPPWEHLCQVGCKIFDGSYLLVCSSHDLSCTSLKLPSCGPAPWSLGYDHLWSNEPYQLPCPKYDIFNTQNSGLYYIKNYTSMISSMVEKIRQLLPLGWVGNWLGREDFFKSHGNSLHINGNLDYMDVCICQKWSETSICKFHYM